MSVGQEQPAPQNSAGQQPAPASDSISRTLADLGPAGILAALASFLPAIGGTVLATYVDTVGKWLKSHGSQGLAMYAVGFAVLAGLAITPTHVCAFLGGWAFGATQGTIAALLGFLGGALIAYAIARPTAAGRVESILANKQKWKTIRDALVGGSPAKTLGIVTLVRVPLTPFALTNMILASVRVPVWIYATGTLIGMIPRTAVVVWLGSQLQNQLASEASKQKPWWLVAGGIALSFVALWICGAIANKALAKLTQEPATAK